MAEEKKQTVLERGLDAKKFIEAPIYQKVLNNLIDECIGAWASSKIEEKEEEMYWHRYQSSNCSALNTSILGSIHGTRTSSRIR